MNHFFGKSLVALPLIVAVFVTGCAPMTETQREVRENRRTEFRQQFVEDRAECSAEGRHMFVTTFGGGVDRDGIPKTRTRYFCS